VATGVGREIGFSVSLRPILGETEKAAWDKAYGILAAIESSDARFPDKPLDRSAARMLAHADQRDVHDERLWMGIAKATGAVGNTSCLVGTPEQVAESIAAYHSLGVQRFLLRGFDPLADARDFGRELLPLVREMTGD